jgi:hypothetical protein
MNTAQRVLGSRVLAGAMLFAACSSDPVAQAVTEQTLTMAAQLPAGSETHKCQFFRMPEGKHFITASSHTYTPGSHHLIVFSTDLTAIPAGMDQLADCYEGAGGFMSHVRGVVYGAQVPSGTQTMPSGVGLEVASGAVVLMQTHYLNASPATIDASAEVKLTFSDESAITQKAGVLFFYDPFIHVPAHEKGARAQMRCLVQNDITLISAVSHYHKRGYDYAAYLDPTVETLTQTPFYTSSDWDHPESLSAPMKIAGGNRIRFNCGYDNTDGTKDYYQGQSAENDEMCMFSGVYYPAMTESDDLCMVDSDQFGTGTATCGDTLKCFQACPPGSAPGDISPDTLAAVDPCWQSCFVASCGGASAKLFALDACTQAKCKTDCVDSASAACTNCAAANCLAEGAACLGDTCS